MKSRWYELKDDAVKLRRKGLSIGKIERCLGIRRSTLSSWFKNIKLSEKQKNKLFLERKKGLIKARKKAVLWHNKQKQNRLKIAQEEAIKTVNNINISDINVLELSLSMLYLGEGSKRNIETAIGSSDPVILKFFLASLKKIYNLDIKKIKCELGLRADQNPEEIKRFWSKTLSLPLNSFRQISIDKRTIGSKTYPNYKGVCNLRCGNVAIQRKLMNVSNFFCKKVINKYLGS